MSEPIDIIMRQTMYTREESIEQLSTHNNDYMKVIEEYMGIKSTPSKTITSVNQEKYTQFRSLMDSGSESHRKKQLNQQLNQ
jgi:hypothetical protein